MSELNTDHEDMNRARNSVAYNGCKNSIVEWTLSDAWSDVSQYEGTKQPRGKVTVCGFHITTNTCEGEISNAH